eukprot:1728511-Amphidinium_carterae.1
MTSHSFGTQASRPCTCHMGLEPCMALAPADTIVTAHRHASCLVSCPNHRTAKQTGWPTKSLKWQNLQPSTGLPAALAAKPTQQQPKTERSSELGNRRVETPAAQHLTEAK